MTLLEGVDLSNNNDGAADWDHSAFAILKASEGVTYTDRLFDTYAAQAELHGVILGAYHFAHPDTNSAAAEAAYFLARRGKATLLAVDIESRQAAGKTVDPLSIMGPQALAEWIETWCAAVRDATGITPHVYLNRSYLKALAPFLGAWPIWLATLDGSKPVTYAGWPIAIVQHSITDDIDRNTALVPLTPEEDELTDELKARLDAIDLRLVDIRNQIGDSNGPVQTGLAGALHKARVTIKKNFALLGGKGDPEA